MTRSLTLLVAGLLTAVPLLAQEATTPPPATAASPVDSSAELMPLAASQSLLTDFTQSSNRAIAVGERGHVLVSESRDDWRQIADVPTRVTLTAVEASGERVWAVGHEGSILHSADGGLSWSVQRTDPWTPLDPDAAWDEFDPARGAPLLDLLVLDEDSVIAVGAYAQMLRTDDAGASWHPVDVHAGPAAAAEVGVAGEGAGEVLSETDGLATDDGVDADDSWTFSDEDLMLDAEEDPHLNGIARTGDGSLFVVAERGSAFRSIDGGVSWERLQLPYDGSMFGVLGLQGRHVLAFGLRGNILESRDLGDSWEEVDSGTELSLQGGALLENGGAVIVGANGVVLVRDSIDDEFRVSTFENEREETPVLSAVLPLGSRTFLVCGEKGIGRYQLAAGVTP